MAGKPIVLLPLLLLTLLLGCTVAIGNANQQKQPPDSAARTLPEIKKECTLCHASSDVRKGAAQLKKPVATLCLDCHPDRKSAGEHKVDIAPAKPVAQLPLSEGKMTCITCHDPHQNTFGRLLRMPKSELCLACHPY